MWLRGVATHLIGQFKVERCPYWLDVHLIECKAKPRAGSAITLSASDFEHILPSKLLTIPPGRWNLCCGYSRCCVPACQSVSPRGGFSANQLSAKLLCGPNTWDLREPSFDVVGTFLVVPVATRLFVGGRSKRLLRLSIDDGLPTCQNGLASRSVVDLRPMDGFVFRQRESFVHTVMSRYMSELICRTFQTWESTPLWRRMNVRVHLKSFEYPAPARFPRALLGRCLWISGVLLLLSCLVDLCDWWPTALNAMLGQLWKYSLLHFSRQF